MTSGYRTHLLFLWLESAELAVSRVAERVRVGGHDVPEATIRRRYDSGLRNLFSLYLPVVDSWQVLDNSAAPIPGLIAAGSRGAPAEVQDARIWRRILEAHRAEH